MAKKEQIKVVVATWDSYELDGDLPVAISKLSGLITNNPNLFDFKIELETESGYYSSCSTNINVWAYRWETDEELAARLATSRLKKEAERKRKEKEAEENKTKERLLYESLKRKFEKEIDETSKQSSKQ